MFMDVYKMVANHLHGLYSTEMLRCYPTVMENHLLITTLLILYMSLLFVMNLVACRVLYLRMQMES